jgi:predicted regulator of Ras-like GTPase activity (Roadblock/LC7/MglB family)
MSDDIRGMTAELAADPDSLVFLDLGEALRRRNQLDAAYKVARTGANRYPELARAHDLCARILCDRGDRDRAFESWVSALDLDPVLVSAHKGLGFLYFQAGDFASAEKHLAYAGQADPDDVGTAAALERVHALQRTPAPASAPPPAVASPATAAAGSAPPPADAADAELDSEPVLAASELPFSFEESRPSPLRDAVFAGLDGGTDGLLLVDSAGLRLGGGLRNPEGTDVADSVAAMLAGVSKEAARTARLLDLGDWRGLAVECGDGNLFLSAPTDSTLLLTVRGLDMPMGRVARFAERASVAARAWLEGSQ